MAKYLLDPSFTVILISIGGIFAYAQPVTRASVDISSIQTRYLQEGEPNMDESVPVQPRLSDQPLFDNTVYGPGQTIQ